MAPCCLISENSLWYFWYSVVLTRNIWKYIQNVWNGLISHTVDEIVPVTGRPAPMWSDVFRGIGVPATVGLGVGDAGEVLSLPPVSVISRLMSWTECVKGTPAKRLPKSSVETTSFPLASHLLSLKTCFASLLFWMFWETGFSEKEGWREQSYFPELRKKSLSEMIGVVLRDGGLNRLISPHITVQPLGRGWDFHWLSVHTV